MYFSETPSLRMSLDLCEDELDFLKARRPKVRSGLAEFLNENEKNNLDSFNDEDLPTTCLMTSGGGFRAMNAYCGVFKALEESGLIHCLTYMAALSGSSW